MLVVLSLFTRSETHTTSGISGADSRVSEKRERTRPKRGHCQNKVEHKKTYKHGENKGHMAKKGHMPISVWKSYHDIFEDESFTFPGRIQSWVFLCTSDLDTPDLLPGIVEHVMGRIHSRVVRSYGITLPYRNVVALNVES